MRKRKSGAKKKRGEGKKDFWEVVDFDFFFVGGRWGSFDVWAWFFEK